MRFRLVVALGFACAGCVVLPAAESPITSTASDLALRVATFDVDATPPVGSLMAYDPVTNRWDLGLRARGIVLVGAGEPIVLCAYETSPEASNVAPEAETVLLGAIRRLLSVGFPSVR